MKLLLNSSRTSILNVKSGRILATVTTRPLPRRPRPTDTVGVRNLTCQVENVITCATIEPRFSTSSSCFQRLERGQGMHHPGLSLRCLRASSSCYSLMRMCKSKGFPLTATANADLLVAISPNRLLQQTAFIHTKPKFSKLLDGNVDVTSSEFQNNAKHYDRVEKRYLEVLTLAKSGGGEKAELRHVQVNKKMLVMDRLSRLFDNMDEVLELSTISGMGMPYGNIHRAGSITMIGKIQGIYCLVIASDATVKAGTLFPISVKKSQRAQEICIENHTPCLFLVDSGGAFLPLQDEIFIHGGRGFYNEAIMNSKDIPVLSLVCGSCTAGAAYIPTMAQENVIVHKIGTIFLGGPPLVLAALKEVVSPEELGGGIMHSSVSGCTDHFAATEEEALKTTRDIVTSLNITAPEHPSEFDDPLFSPGELPGLIPWKDQHLMNMPKILARLVDGSRFQEFKAQYGINLLTGFATIHGHLVGIVANNGPMTEDAASKGAHFVQLSAQRNVPLVFLQNSAPDDMECAIGDKAEILGNRLRCHARLLASIACAHVPKFTVIVGNSFGVDNYLMAGRSFSPRFLFSWPNARIAIMEPSKVIDSLVQAKFGKADSSSDEEVAQYRQKVSERVMQQTSAIYSSSRLWDDGIILPQDTRKVLVQCLEVIKQGEAMAKDNSGSPYGVIRM